MQTSITALPYTMPSTIPVNDMTTTSTNRAVSSSNHANLITEIILPKEVIGYIFVHIKSMFKIKTRPNIFLFMDERDSNYQP